MNLFGSFVPPLAWGKRTGQSFSMGQLMGFPCKNDFSCAAIVFCCSFQGDGKQQSRGFMLSQASKCLLPCYSHAANCSDLRVLPVQLRARKRQLHRLHVANIISKIQKNCSDLHYWCICNLSTVQLFKVNAIADSLKFQCQLFAIGYSSIRQITMRGNARQSTPQPQPTFFF